jgi:hypothetical protein
MQVLLAAALIGCIAVVARGRLNAPDPHYVAVREMLDDYETTRPEGTRNYGDPVYARALEELARVDPDSVSADPAAALAAEIRGHLEAFQRAQQTRRERVAENLEKRRKERDAQLRAHRLGQVDRVSAEDDCSDH